MHYLTSSRSLRDFYSLIQMRLFAHKLAWHQLSERANRRRIRAVHEGRCCVAHVNCIHQNTAHSSYFPVSHPPIRPYDPTLSPAIPSAHSSVSFHPSVFCFLHCYTRPLTSQSRRRLPIRPSIHHTLPSFVPSFVPVSICLPSPTRWR